jgi:hypothetical protein
LRKRRRRLLEGGLIDAESFPISHLRSRGKGLTCDCLAPHRSARKVADPRLIPRSAELATGFLFPSPPWPAKGVQRSTTNPEAAEKDLIDGDPLGGGARLLRPPELDEAGAPHQDAPDLTPEISCPTPNYRQAAKTPKPRPIYNSGASPLPSPAAAPPERTRGRPGLTWCTLKEEGERRPVGERRGGY